MRAPKDTFVADFIGRDRGYRQLGFSPVHPEQAVRAEPSVELATPQAAAQAIADGDWLLVTDDSKPLGWVNVATVNERISRSDVNLGSTFAPLSGTLRQLTDVVLNSHCQRGAVVDEQGRLRGSVTFDAVLLALRERRAG